jgi:hypothetical protein
VGGDLATLSAQTGTYTGYLGVNKVMTVNLKAAYSGFYGLVQVQGSGCIAFKVRNAAPPNSSKVEIEEPIEINNILYRIATPNDIGGAAYDLRGKIRFQCTADGVIQITNLGTENEAIWIGGMIDSVTIA